MINWQLSKQGIRWPLSSDRTAGLSVNPSRSSIFLSYPLTNYQFQMIAGSSLFSSNDSYEICYLGRENSARFLKIQAGKTFSYHGHSLFTLYVQFLCSNWSKFDRWYHAENLCSILKVVYFDSWRWQSFVSTCDVFNWHFSTGCTKWNIPAIKSLLLFMAGLFIGFLAEKCDACQNSFIRFRMESLFVFVFHLA